MSYSKFYRIKKVSDFGKAIHKLRTSADLTQEKLAEKANYSLSAMSKIENSTSSNAQTILDFLNALDCSLFAVPNHLFEDTSDDISSDISKLRAVQVVRELYLSSPELYRNLIIMAITSGDDQAAVK